MSYSSFAYLTLTFSFQFSVGADGLKQALATGQGTPPAAAAPAAPAASGKARRFIREY